MIRYFFCVCLLLRVVYRPREEEKKWRSEPNKKKKNNEYILNLSLPSQTDETNENQKILLVLNLNFSFSNEYVLFYFFVEVCELLCDFFCSGFGFLNEKLSTLLHQILYQDGFDKDTKKSLLFKQRNPPSTPHSSISSTHT